MALIEEKKRAAQIQEEKNKKKKEEAQKTLQAKKSQEAKIVEEERKKKKQLLDRRKLLLEKDIESLEEHYESLGGDPESLKATVSQLTSDLMSKQTVEAPVVPIKPDNEKMIPKPRFLEEKKNDLTKKSPIPSKPKELPKPDPGAKRERRNSLGPSANAPAPPTKNVEPPSTVSSKSISHYRAKSTADVISIEEPTQPQEKKKPKVIPSPQTTKTKRIPPK